jgi:ketopantoate reductase
MDILQKNKFIDGIKIEGMTGETTIGEMMEYQREKLEAISEFFKGASLNLHYHKKENLPKDFFKEDTNGKD